MLLLRVVGVLLVVFVGACVVAWLFSRDSRYLSWAIRVSKAALGFALLVLVLMAAERLLIL